MNVREWRRAGRAVHDDFYDDLVGTAGCGAYDGGCPIVARALQLVIGGDIVVIVRRDDAGEYAAVLKDGKLWDYARTRCSARWFTKASTRTRAPFGRSISIRPGLSSIDEPRDGAGLDGSGATAAGAAIIAGPSSFFSDQRFIQAPQSLRSASSSWRRASSS